MSFSNEFIKQSLNNLAMQLAIIIGPPLIILIPLVIFISINFSGRVSGGILGISASLLYACWIWFYFTNIF